MPEATPRIVNCPTCGEPVAWTEANRYRPFCGKRCKMIDLGEWAAENYRLPDTEKPVDDGANSGQT